MSTTIDSLQIEIQSNSANASAGIRQLSTALSELKKNSSLGVATKNLKTLSDTLAAFRNASNATTAIGKLSGALDRLKNIGSVAGIANSIKKLADNLRNIDNVNIDSVAPQIERIAAALAPLSAVKAGGINTMMNGLKKLGEVTKSLDDDTIGAFVERVEKLNDALGPLSQKMSTIKSGFTAINTGARSASGGVKKLGNDVNATTLNLASMITVMQGVISALQPVIRALTNAISQAIEWDGIAARFGRGFGPQAEETYAWIQRLNKEMGINVQQFMQYSSVYATMLTGFGVAMEDAGKMALGYTELTYDIWAGYNDIYKNFADAAEAVKSAIAGEVEPIRRAGFTIVEATLKQTAANHGLEISLEKATEAQKSYLRYLTLVDQANAQGLVGTYAKELNTAEGLMRTLAQQTKSLAQAFGSLFLPILVRVIPYVQALVEVLTDAVFWLASLFGIELQAVDWSGFGDGIGGVADSANDATDALGSATKAAKDLKNATTGIDELNIISPQSASGGGSGSGSGGAGFDGLDVDSLWNESIFDDVQNKVKELKDQVKEALLDLVPVVAGVATALGGLKLTQLLDDLDLADTKWSKLSKGITVAGIALAVGKLVWDFTGAYLEDGNWASFFSALGTTAIGAGLAYKFAGKGGLGFTLMVSGVAMLTRLVFELSEGTVDFGDPETWITMITGGIETLVGGVITWKVVGPTITKAVKGLFSGQALASIGTTVGSALTGGWTAITGALAAIPVWGWIAAAIVGAIALSFVDYDFTDIGHTIGEKIGTALRWAFDNLSPIGLAVKLGNWLMTELDVDSIWEVIKVLFDPKTWTEKIFPAIGEFFSTAAEEIEKKIDNLKGNINEFFGGFFDGLFDGLGVDMSWAEKITEFFDIEYLDIVEAIVNPKSIGKHIITGINNGINSSEKLSALRDKISAMWTEAKTWWDTKKSALATYTPSIGDIKKKLSSAWSAAKTWWDKTKAKLATYTPSIGSIKDKLSSAWTTAKNWWSRTRSSLSYTPTIGSIKDKLVSAWNTAKNWWNKNVKLSIPSLSFKVAYSKPSGVVQKAVVKALGLDGWPKLSFAANGGMFDAGSLIWAGERGPEVVANAAGGKTGVMNVQQMSDAVYEGVYAAMAAAMRGNGGGGEQAVNIYLDGKQIYASMEQHKKERGASLMGNQVYAY